MVDRFYIIKSARPPLSILICSSYIACVANNTHFTRIYCKSSKPWQYSSPSGSAPSSSSSSRYSTCTGSDGFCATTAVLSRSPTIAPLFHQTGRNPFSRTPQSAAHKHTLKGTKQLHWNSKKTRFLPGDTRIFSFSDLSLFVRNTFPETTCCSLYRLPGVSVSLGQLYKRTVWNSMWETKLGIHWNRVDSREP